MNVYYVYTYRDPRNDQVFYVGKGKDRRYLKHLTEAKKPTSMSAKAQIIREILEANFTPIIEKVAENLSEPDALQMEKDLIAFYGKENLTNKTTGGQGVSGFQSFLGRHHSEATKQKLREAKLGSNNPMYGKKRSEESMRKFKAAISGENHPHYGKSPSEQTKRKISDTLKGCVVTDHGKAQRREGMKRVWEQRRLGLRPQRKQSTSISKPISDETRQKMSQSKKNQPKIICPYCQKECSPQALGRYHKHTNLNSD